MSYLIVLKLINRISIVFAILEFIFGLAGSERVSGILYIWVCIFSFGISYFNNRKKVISVLLSLMMFIPLIFVKSTNRLIFEIAVMLFSIYISYRNVLDSDYELEIDAFKKGVILFSVMFIISVITLNLEIFDSFSTQYILIYLISSVVIMRTMRLIKYNKDNSDGKRINRRYTICMIAFAAVMSIDAVKSGIIKGISFIYNIIAWFFEHVLYWLIIGFGYAMEFLMSILTKLFRKLAANDNDVIIKNTMRNKKILKGQGESFAEILFNSPIFKVIFRIALVFLILYVVIKIIKGMSINREEENGYIEDKEFIKRERKGHGDLIRKISLSIRPKSPVEYIRYYYQRFMNLCIKKGVLITNKDTTKEINDKSKVEFDDVLLEGMRGIYIKTRYSNDEISKDMAEDFKKSYGKIKTVKKIN